jgi:hypothetical protein
MVWQAMAGRLYSQGKSLPCLHKANRTPIGLVGPVRIVFSQDRLLQAAKLASSISHKVKRPAGICILARHDCASALLRGDFGLVMAGTSLRVPSG